MTSRDAPNPLPRRRVTAPRGPKLLSASGTRSRVEAIAPGEQQPIYLTTLMRVQLRLAIVCCIAFLVTITSAAIALAAIEPLQTSYVFGVPWSWVLQAYGMYPLVVFFAILYVGAAGRNERRYRQLQGTA